MQANRWFSKQTDSYEMLSIIDRFSDRISVEISTNKQDRDQITQTNQLYFNEFLDRQRSLKKDRKSRHRHRKNLGQQHVKEWLDAPVT